MRLCSYVVKIDSGFAPNPFSGFCTLATCTPNHQGCRLEPGDWVLGNSSADTGRRLIYAMQISEVLDFDDYYRDPRFAVKKARAGSWQERCGDNIYRRDEDGEWVQAVAFFHTTPGIIEQDLRHPRVFISDYFFYFGENAPAIPTKFATLVQIRQGTSYHQGVIVQAFIDWLQQTYQPGLLGEPRDREHDLVTPCGLDPTKKPAAPSGNCNIASVSRFRTTLLPDGLTLLEVWHAEGKRTKQTYGPPGETKLAEVQCRKLLERGYERIV
jgi:hypothetical protein